ncbi:MAG TPA: rhodanese-like domain-containing protein [Telluria sp.]|jgi:rhodanese-related sulfurtransferase
MTEHSISRSMRIAGAAVLLLLAAPGQCADTPPKAADDGMPAILKGIAQATGACRVGDGGPALHSALGGAKPDFGCGVLVATARQVLQRPEAVAIDLRPAGEFEHYHVDGAIQASLSDLTSKPYWRDKTVLLMGNGKSERELYSACATLKKTYKEVLVLRGGVPMWLFSGASVAGRAPAPSALVRLAAPELWLETQNEGTLVVLSKSQSALEADIAFARPLPETSAAAIIEVIDKRRKANKKTPLSAIVLVAEADFSDDKIVALQRSLPAPLLVYTGGREAYKQQMKTQLAIWLAHSKGPKQLGCGQ